MLVIRYPMRLVRDMLISVVGAYLALVLAEWSLNPSTWVEESRWFYLLSVAILFLIDVALNVDKVDGDPMDNRTSHG